MGRKSERSVAWLLLTTRQTEDCGWVQGITGKKDNKLKVWVWCREWQLYYQTRSRKSFMLLKGQKGGGEEKWKNGKILLRFYVCLIVAFIALEIFLFHSIFPSFLCVCVCAALCISKILSFFLYSLTLTFVVCWKFALCFVCYLIWIHSCGISLPLPMSELTLKKNKQNKYHG